MSHSSPSPADWKRLGEQLTRRRVELDSRYSNRTAFSAERGIDYRLAYDIEEARRSNFRPATLMAVAVAYAVTTESVHAALRGGDLDPVSGSRLSAVPPLPGLPDAGEVADEVIVLLLTAHPDREFLAKLWALEQPRSERLDLLRGWLHRDDPEPGENRAAGPAS